MEKEDKTYTEIIRKNSEINGRIKRLKEKVMEREVAGK